MSLVRFPALFLDDMRERVRTLMLWGVKDFALTYLMA